MTPLGRLGARGQLWVRREYPRLLPRLLGLGLGPEDALAVAFNATLVFHALLAPEGISSPWELLERHSLEELADLCAEYLRVEQGEVEYGVNREGEASG